jgi:hypothetical protein
MYLFGYLLDIPNTHGRFYLAPPIVISQVTPRLKAMGTCPFMQWEYVSLAVGTCHFCYENMLFSMEIHPFTRGNMRF